MLIPHWLMASIRARYGYYVLWAVRFILPVCWLIAAFQYCPGIYEAVTSGDYVKTNAVMKDAVIERFHHESTTTWTVRMLYTYQVDGVGYRGTNYDAFGPYVVKMKDFTGSAPIPDSFRERFGPGSHLKIWYNPQKPECAFIEKGVGTLSSHIQEIFVLIGGFILCIVLWCIHSRKYKVNRKNHAGVAPK